MFEKLINWSNKQYSDLPWRKKRTVYTTLVSEIMLQQTTVGTVLNHFPRFMKKYPTLSSLAEQTEEGILADWKGLGYYRRAKNLLKAVKYIKHHYHGKVPNSYDELVRIDGIGPYTANAILAIGRDQPCLALDANLERVLSRFYGIKVEKGIKLQKELYSLFEENKICFPEIKKVGGRAYNESLMDLGRSVCKANTAYCDLCPLNKNCVALKENLVNQIPVRPDLKRAEKEDLFLLRVVVRDKGKVLAYKKDEQDWLGGQYELPTYSLYSTDKKLKQYPELAKQSLFITPTFKSAITKYKITNFVLECSEKELKTLTKRKYEWVEVNQGALSVSSLKSLKQ